MSIVRNVVSLGEFAMRLPILGRWRSKAQSKPKYPPRRRRVLVIAEEDEPPPSAKGFFDRRGSFILFAAVFAIAATAAVMAIDRYFASIATDANPGRPAQVAMGRAVYRQSCSYCHGADREGHEDWLSNSAAGTGLAPPLDERSPAVDRSDRWIFEIVKYGGQPFTSTGVKSQMPAFEFSLSDAQVWGLVAYLKNRWPEEILARHEIANRARP